jgi:hypothetical protein
MKTMNSSDVGGPVMKDTTLLLILGLAVAVSVVPTLNIMLRYAQNSARTSPQVNAPIWQIAQMTGN